MSEIDREESLRKHLGRLLDWEEAHPGFDAAVSGIPPKLRGVAPDGWSHSPWQLLEHLRLAQWDILDFCRNSAYVKRKWPDDYWPGSAVPQTLAAWDESVAAFLRDRETLKQLAMDRTVDLFAPIPHSKGHSVLRELLLIADHNAYHVGQMIAVRRALGIWKAA